MSQVRYSKKILLRGGPLPEGAPSSESIITGIILLAEAMGEIKFYPYQNEFAMGTVESVVLNLSKQITALFSRQSGKSEIVGDVSAAMALALPWLAKTFPDDWRFNRTDDNGIYRGFKNGLSIGIYAPKHTQALITLERMRRCCETETTREIMREMGTEWDISNGTTVGFNNGSTIKAISASPQSKIEGETHHLLILEEAQDLDRRVIEKSLSPMLASTRGTQVMIGTANFGKSKFYEQIQSNRRQDLDTKSKSHFFYPAEVCGKYNSDYKEYVEKEKRNLGEESDHFRTSYKCEFILERGMFITESALFDEKIGLKYGAFSSLYSGGIDTPPRPFDFVAGIDFASVNDATAITVVAVNWEEPVIDEWIERADGSEERYTAYERHIVAWKTLQNMNYEEQFDLIKGYLYYWPRLRQISLDATSMGKPIFDRFSAEFSDFCEIKGMVFTAKLKSDGYKYLSNELLAKRLTFPNGIEAAKTNEHRRFVVEMLDLEREYKQGGLLHVHHSDVPGARDDFPDSLMLAVYGSAEEPGALTHVEDESAWHPMHI